MTGVQTCALPIYTSFSVGDRVKYVGPKKGLVGEEGTVIKNLDRWSLSGYSRKIQVRFDHGRKKTVRPLELQKIE